MEVCYLGDPRSQVGTHEEFEALELGLDDDEAEVGFWVEVACLFLDELNLERMKEISKCS